MLKNLNCMAVSSGPYKPDAVITVVSGLPRSGTSMMMRVLAFGGVAPLTDAVRERDSHNPHGYFEYERVKQARPCHLWIDEAAGRSIKLVSRFIPRLPATHQYKVLFMHRDIREVIRSQREMALQYSGADWQGATLNQLAEVYRGDVARCLRWMQCRPNVSCLEIQYEEVLNDGQGQLQRVAEFLSPRAVDVLAMTEAIDQRLNHSLRTAHS